MRKNLWTRLGVVISAGFLLAACGDNILAGGDDDPTIDASLIDGEPMPDAEIDGPTAEATIGGTLAVFDATLTDPSAGLVGGVRGGAIRMSFNDLTTNGGEVVFAGGVEAPIGSCLIQKFDADSLPNPRLDAGPITISGPESGASALLKTVGPCTLQAAFGDPDPYMCISHNVTSGMGGAQDLGTNSLVAYNLADPTVDFGTRAPVTISSASRNSDVSTITTATPHGYAPGMFATITDVVTVGVTSFNGRHAITGVPSATTFTFAQTGLDTDIGTGGESTVPTFVIVGSALVVNGFANTAFNSGAAAFPIVSQLDANTLVVINAAPANGAAAASATLPYTVINGASPVPGAAALSNFLGGSTGTAAASIRIQKAQNSVWPAIDFSVDVPGEQLRSGIVSATRATDVVTVVTSADHGYVTGNTVTVAGVVDASFNGTFVLTGAPTATSFTYADAGTDGASAGGTSTRAGFTLDAGSQLAHVFPTTTAAAVNYSCDNDTSGSPGDDTCGDESSTTLKAMIISGSASKKSVAGIFPFQMPTEVPGTDEWLEWQCAFLLSKSADMPEAAVQAIIDFGPTRVEQQILFVAGTILDDGGGVNQMRVLSGHALAGHQTFCPAAGNATTGFGTPACPACNDGVDNDSDGDTDFPATRTAPTPTTPPSS